MIRAPCGRLAGGPCRAKAAATAAMTAGIAALPRRWGTDSSNATDLLYGAGIMTLEPPSPVPRYRTIRSLGRDLRRCRRCAGAGYPIESEPVVHGIVGQPRLPLRAGARHRGGCRRSPPWRGRAGRTLRRWLELDEEAFYATFYCASVTRCYPRPGTAAAATGRRPLPSSGSAAPWRTEELRLLRPELVITVGGLAARAIVGARTLGDCVGKSYLIGGAVAIPLPPPLGRQRLAERSRQPRASRQGAHARPARSRSPPRTGLSGVEWCARMARWPTTRAIPIRSRRRPRPRDQASHRGPRLGRSGPRDAAHTGGCDRRHAHPASRARKPKAPARPRPGRTTTPS